MAALQGCRSEGRVELALAGGVLVGIIGELGVFGTLSSAHIELGGSSPGNR